MCGLAFAVALCACGGKSASTASSSATSATPNTTATMTAKALYVSRANAICQDMNDQIRALPTGPSDASTIAHTADRAAAITGAALQSLRELATPNGDAQTLRMIYAKVDRVIKDENQLSAELLAANVSAAKTLVVRLRADTQAANAATNAYGMTVCGESS